MHILLQSQGANTFSSQFVLRQGVEDCISTMVGHCALNLATPLTENCPPKFRAYSVKTLLGSKRESGTDVGME